MRVGEYVNADELLGEKQLERMGKMTPRTRASKFESILINTAHAVQSLIDRVTDDLNNNPPVEGEEKFVVRGIREALDEIYKFDTKKYFAIKLTPGGNGQWSVNIVIRGENERREVFLLLEEMLEREVEEARHGKR